MNAITLYFAVVILVTLAKPNMDFCGYMVAIGISLLSILVGIAALRLPSRYPERYANAFVRFPKWALALCTAIAVISSAGFCALVGMESPLVVILYAAWTGAIVVWYAFRSRWLSRRGAPLDAACRMIPGEDE
jgi:hypothetical protein